MKEKWYRLFCISRHGLGSTLKFFLSKINISYTGRVFPYSRQLVSAHIWLSSILYNTREYVCPSLQLTLPQLKLVAVQTDGRY
jgi:hypothetical protein